MSQKRVVAFGGTGFIGKSLEREISTLGFDFLPVSSSQINLLEPNSLEKILDLIQANDYIVFLSAITPDKGKGFVTFERNIKMLDGIAEALRQKKIRHFTYISSDAVYDVSQNIVDEKILPAPVDTYGAMHRSREIILKDLCAQIGVPFLCVRPVAVYGEGDSHNSYGPNRFLSTAIKDGVISVSYTHLTLPTKRIV